MYYEFDKLILDEEDLYEQYEEIEGDTYRKLAVYNVILMVKDAKARLAGMYAHEKFAQYDMPSLVITPPDGVVLPPKTVDAKLPEQAEGLRGLETFRLIDGQV